MPQSRRSTIAILIVAHLLAGALFLAPGYIRPDSVAVYAYVRSAIVDGDFAFFNEWAMTGLVRHGITLFSEVTKSGALANHWWIGTSLIVAPVYAIARVVAVVAPPLASGDGFSGLYATVFAWSSVAFSIVTMWIAVILTRHSADRLARTVAIASAAIGTPYFWYVFRFPLGTHAAGAFCVALIVGALFIRTDDATDRAPLRSTTALGLAVGFATGLAIATRLQHFVLVPAVVYASARAKRPAAYWIAAIAGGAIPLGCQAIAWQAIYGTPFGPLTRGANFEGTTWMPFQHLTFLTVLCSSWHGLFSWSPIALLAVAGWFFALRRDDVRRTLAITLLLMFAGEWFANGAFDRYFWGGLSFGGRRFVDLFVPFAIGLVWLAEAAGRWIAVAYAACSAWSIALMAAAAAGTVSLARYVSAADLFAAVFSSRTWSRAIALFAHSPIEDASVAAQSVVAVLIIAAMAMAIAALVRTARGATMAAIAYCAALVLGTTIAAMNTRGHAAVDATRLRIDVAASSRVGPLIDQRGLLIDEIAYSRAVGDANRAAATSAEVAAIDRLINQLTRSESAAAR